MKSLIISSFLLTFLVMGNSLNAQKFSELDKSPLDIAMFRGQDKAPRVRVIYSRPQRKGRDVFAAKDTYTLFTIPGEKEWTVILNKDLDTWGAYGYKQERDLLRITTPARKTAAPIESFSISFQPTEAGSDMFLGWDDSYIQVPVEEVE